MFLLMLAALALSCEDKGSNIPDWPWEDPVEEVPATLDQWTEVSSDYGALPAGIKIYKSPETLEGKAAIAYIAVADMTSVQWDVWSVKSDGSYATEDSYKTPSTVYQEGEWPVVINGGYFYHYDGVNYTSSLAVSGSELLAYNINYASEDWVVMYYPTRAVFLESDNGVFDACWTYFNGEVHYMYPSAAEIDWDLAVQPVPSAEFPEGGEEFSAKTAIGGGPVLVDQGRFVDSYVDEFFGGTSGIGPDSDQPRTAIGVTADSKLIFFVCEGREMTEGVKGLTTADVANVLIDLGCTEAINLDGGGSSCMLVNGTETIKVSDGSERSVASTVMLK